MKLPNLSVAAKLYGILALLATVTVTLAAVAVVNARQNAAITADFDAAFRGMQNVEKVNGLVYAVVMESRGIYMSPDIPTARKYGTLLLQFNDRIGEVVKEWRKIVRPEDASQFDEFAKRIAQFQDFRQELVRRGTQNSPAAGREWGDNDANRTVRTALNKDLDGLSALYEARSKHMYALLDDGIRQMAWTLSMLAAVALGLAGLGAVIIWRAVARPLHRITRVTEAVAGGA